jgi:hypothetical protein
VAVDETRDRGATTSVELVDLVPEGLQVAHAADGDDPSRVAKHERVLDDVHASHRVAPA